MKTKQAIQVLRNFNLWRRGEDENLEQPDQYTIGEAIDDVLMAIGDMEDEAKLHRGAITGWQNKWKCAVEIAAKAQAERDEACADLEFRRGLFKLQEQQLNSVRSELDEERKEGEEQARLLGMGSEREAKLIAERDLWRKEAERWRNQALDLDAQLESIVSKLTTRMSRIECSIQQMKEGY